MIPNRKLPAIPEQSPFERFDTARAMLVVHGFLTKTESDNVKKRMKQLKKNKSGNNTK